jgi:hypothetical protein
MSKTCVTCSHFFFALHSWDWDICDVDKVPREPDSMICANYNPIELDRAADVEEEITI